MNDILLGDCLEILPTLPDQSIDLVLCDLPYGKTTAAWDIVLPMADLWRAYKRLVKPHGAIVLTSVQPFTSLLVTSNLQWYRHCWVWQKHSVTGFLNSKKAPLREHEDILVFSQQAPNYYPIMRDGYYRNRRKNKQRYPSIHYSGSVTDTVDYREIRTELYPRSVLNFPLDRDCHFHPTQKPVALFEYLIKTYSKTGDVVLDHCSGSATTAVAAIHTGRQYICIEKDETYWRKSLRRVEIMKPWQVTLLEEAIP